MWAQIKDKFKPDLNISKKEHPMPNTISNEELLEVYANLRRWRKLSSGDS